MPVTATAECRKIVVSSLARPTAEKRRGTNWDARPSTECISRKSASPVSPIANDKLSEAEAIERARDGDRAVFEFLYRLHSRRVYAVCLRMVGDTTEAEDLTQEAFLLLFRKIHTFRGESAFSTWLHRLAVNLVLVHLRKKSLPAVSIEATPGSDNETGSPSTDIGAPDLLLEGSIDRINLERCIERLPVGYRTVFVLHDIQGHRHSEIAEILGRSVGDSKSQLHKARARLRELLRETQREKARDERLAGREGKSRSRTASMLLTASLFLALLPCSVKAVEMGAFSRNAATFNGSNTSGASARTLSGHYATVIDAQNGNDWPVVIRTEVVLALPASRERTEALIEASKDGCLGDDAMAGFQSVLGASSAPIPFQLADSLIYLQASLNGSQPLWMMLDTGSSVTVFDESVSKTLGIQFLGEGIAYGPGQGSAQKLALAGHTTLMVGAAELRDQTVATLPLEWFSRAVGRSTDGFLGSNVFLNYVVEIDYANQLLRLHDPATYLYSGSGQRLPLQFLWDTIPSVRAEVVAQDGTAIAGVFLIDSGATTALWLTKAFSDAHPEFLSAQETIEVQNVVAVGGELSARAGRVPAIRLGGFVVPMPLTQFSQNISGIFATPDLAGTIGAQMLRRFTVIFDYRHQEMILEPNEHFGDPSA